jgi:hypothetical protein
LPPRWRTRRKQSNGDDDRTIAQIALTEPSNAVDSSANEDPGDQALDVTRALIRLLNDIEGDLRA